VSDDPMDALHVALLPTLRAHAGPSMQVYAVDLHAALREVPGVRAELLSPPFAAERDVGWVRNRWLRYVGYPAWAGRQRADLYHVLDHGNAPLLRRLPRCRTVVTCHDLYPVVIATGQLRFPGAPRRTRMLPTALRLRALRRAGAILAVSQHSAEECVRLLGVPRARVHVVYESISDRFRETPDPAALADLRGRHELGPDDLVVLHVGGSGPRKNLSTVVAAIAQLRHLTGRRVRFVKIGAPLDDGPRQAVERAGLAAGLREPGHVSDAELTLFYRVATVLLYPSFHEGFCRPVVEAMAAGLPVIASTAGAIPEVAVGAAALLPPTDAAGMAERIAVISESPSIRARMVEAGRQASARFTGERHGAVVASAYRRFVEEAA
jgi:glycosyltransferase involved in cell wall biosynthesis